MSAKVSPGVAGNAQVLGWNAAAPLVLTLLPAGHAPGMYFVGLVLVIRTAPSTGTVTRSYQYTSPTFGAANISGFGAGSLTVLGAVAAGFTTVSVQSTGAGPVTLTLTPAAITGATPVVDVYATALKVG